MSRQKPPSLRLTLLLVLLALSAVASSDGWLRDEAICVCLDIVTEADQVVFSTLGRPRSSITLASGESKAVGVTVVPSGEPMRWRMTFRPSREVVAEVSAPSDGDYLTNATFRLVAGDQTGSDSWLLPGEIQRGQQTRLVVSAACQDGEKVFGGLTIRGLKSRFLLEMHGLNTALQEGSPEGSAVLTVREELAEHSPRPAPGDWAFEVSPVQHNAHYLEQPLPYSVDGPTVRIGFRLKPGSGPAREISIPVVVTAHRGDVRVFNRFAIRIFPS